MLAYGRFNKSVALHDSFWDSNDMAKTQNILEEILLKHEAILKDPEPVVKVHELADSSVNFVVRPWVKIFFLQDCKIRVYRFT
jgi:small conductance mechanosensitive channel